MPIEDFSLKSTLVYALAGAVTLNLLAACAVQPESHANLPAQVQAVAPDAWSVDAPQDTLDANAWWSQFGDPVMHQLVESVLNGNLDIQAAVERVKQAQDIVKEQHAYLLPELDATATAAYTRENVPPPLGYVREAGAGVAAQWSPDVFGGQRLSVLAAQAQVSGRQGALDQLRLALAASTATAYIDLRWAQAEMQILSDNEQIRRRALALTQERLHYGLSTQLDVSRAQNQLQDLQAQIPRVQSTIEHETSLIAVYSGRTPESVGEATFAPVREIPVPAQQVPQILPSQALLRRPDVRTAYDGVEQRAAEVGVSKAQRYPQFNLNLSDGLLAASYLGLPTLTDNLFSAALGATSPIFNAGRITAGIDQSESRMRESQLALHQTMLQALKEIEDSRSDLVNGTLEVDRLGSALDASGQALKLSTELYKNGAASFLDVLAAQEAYLRDDEALNQAKRAHAQAAVALYRSLGGGWDAPAADPVTGAGDAAQSGRAVQAAQVEHTTEATVAAQATRAAQTAHVAQVTQMALAPQATDEGVQPASESGSRSTAMMSGRSIEN
jgi:NodT family efflux transporter outer membrane factor (OMF) lipoprotein